MSDLIDLIPALKRAMAVPGGFDAVFPTAVDTELIGLLYDSIAEAQLDGFLHDFVVDPTYETVAPDLSNGEAINQAGALVMVYAAYRVVINEIRNVRNRVLYEAGPVKTESERTASMLNEILRQLHERKKEFVLRAERGEISTQTYVGDLAFIKATGDNDLTAVLAYHPFRGV